jgi:hypothetical protein
LQEAADTAAAHAHEFLPYSTAYQHAEALGVEDKHIKKINDVQAAAAKKGL